MRARWVVAVAGVVIAGTLAGGMLAGHAEAAGSRQGVLVGAHVHSKWLDPASPVSQAQLLGMLQQTGARVVPFGVPLASAGAASVTDAWLGAVAPRPAIPQVNTFFVSGYTGDPDKIRALFAALAPVLASHSNTILVVGANEPLTRGKGWATADEAWARVQLEYKLWHEVSDLPFCHKFTNPASNEPGADWAFMESLWKSSQDAICYDWYTGAKDTQKTLDKLRSVGQRLGKPVHVLEAVVPGNDPATLEKLAQRTTSFSLYQLLATPTDSLSSDAAFRFDGTVTLQPAGSMLQDVTGAGG